MGGWLWSWLEAPLSTPGSVRPPSPPSLPVLCRQHRAVAPGAPGPGPAPALGSQRRLPPDARLLLSGVMAAPSHGPRWAVPGLDRGPGRPGFLHQQKANAARGQRPTASGHPCPGTASSAVKTQRLAVLGMGGEAMKLALSSISWGWPRGSVTTVDIPSAQCLARTVPQGCSAPLAGMQYRAPVFHSITCLCCQ